MSMFTWVYLVSDKSIKMTILLLIYFWCVHALVSQCLCKGHSSSWEFVLSFHDVDPQDWTLMSELVGFFLC